MLIVIAAAALCSAQPPVRQPVLVELFTSEGCSSCPPADLLLERLDREQPVPDAQIIVLSEHVDYWNRLGWADPYSSREFSERQEMYAHRLGLSGPYTPQMVVDGTTEFVGSDARAAKDAIGSAARQPKVKIEIQPSHSDLITVEVSPLAELKPRKAFVFIAHAAETASSDVLRGENKGRKLHHVSIAADIQKAGAVTDREGLKTSVPVGNTAAPPGSRLIAFVQDPSSGRVLGAAMFSIPR
jgi:hypothetical protein